jgi:hypothetical protein
MDQEKGPSAPFQKSPFHTTLIPGTSFLNRFAAFFTLNQDTLIEQHYKITWHKWQGWYCPGINQAPTKRTQKVDRTGPQVPEDDFELLPRMQPYIKLHGSCNWTTSREADRVLVMGGNKTGSIDRFKILRRYHEEFKRRISQPGTKLMIIGYSFGDRHINEAIYEAGAGRRRLFLSFASHSPGAESAGRRETPVPPHCANETIAR